MKEAMYEKHNIEEHSRNHFCHLKAMSITYFFVCVCVRACGCKGAGFLSASVSLLIQHATRMRHIVCDLSGSTLFFNFIS